MKFTIDYEGLTTFLKSLTYAKIKDGALTEGHSRGDINRFYKTDKCKSKITLDQVIEYGEPFLVDAIGNDLSVCIPTRREFKLPTGRKARMKLLKVVVDDCRKVLGSPINGYYVIPCRFITKH